MKILVTGASGLLGSAVSAHFKDYFDVASAYSSHKIEINGCKTSRTDITDAKAALALIKKTRPDVIIHAASLVGINACESQKEMAYRINVEGTKNISVASSKAKSRLIYISTDYVFDGKKGMYKENDEASPLNYYGQTKLEGEKFIDTANNAIIRTSIFGWNVIKERKSFSSWAIGELKAGKKINSFTDQFNSMMLVNDLAGALKKIVDNDFNGVINLASAGRISKYEFVLELCDAFGLDKNLVNPIKLNEMEGKELRPIDTSLDTSKARHLNFNLPDFRTGISRMKNMQETYFKNFKLD